MEAINELGKRMEDIGVRAPLTAHGLCSCAPVTPHGRPMERTVERILDRATKRQRRRICRARHSGGGDDGQLRRRSGSYGAWFTLLVSSARSHLSCAVLTVGG